MGSNNTYKHIEQLTWLRGIAALLVIISHSIRAGEVQYTASDVPSQFFLFSFLDLGTLGVTLFFALSGCALWLSNANISGFHNLTFFYTKRFFRIWPAFVFSIILYLLFIQVFKANYPELKGYWIEEFANDDISLSNIFQYLSLTFNFTGPRYIINNVYWSLPVEFQFYLIFPVLVLSIVYARILGPFIIGAGFYLIGWYQLISIDRYEVFDLAYTFCGGVLLGYCYTEKLLRLKFTPTFCIIISLLLITIATMVRHEVIQLPSHIPVINRKQDWYGIIALIIIALFLFTKFEYNNSKFQKLLSTYGNISYSTYLFHNLFIATSVLIFINFNLFKYVDKLIVTFAFTLIATYLFSLFTYKYVELPGINLGRTMINSYKKWLATFKQRDLLNERL